MRGEKNQLVYISDRDTFASGERTRVSPSRQINLEASLLHLLGGSRFLSAGVSGGPRLRQRRLRLDLL